MKEKKITLRTLILKIILTIIVWVSNCILIAFLIGYTIDNGIPSAGIVKSAKPIIYIYPTEEMELSIKLKKPESLLVSYPYYENGWRVKAFPKGKIEEITSGKSFYSLYYENKANIEVKMNSTGFVVEGKNIASFLDDKLEILGLNYKEREEFIIYWLPILENNKYNYIRFMTKEEIEENMPIEFSRQPDTLIRINMIFKGLNNKVEVKEQKLERVEREGFTIVEWGATEIK